MATHTKEYMDAWKAKNRDKLNAWYRHYYKKNIEKKRVFSINSYHRNKNTPQNKARRKHYEATRKLKNPTQWRLKNFCNNDRRRNTLRSLRKTRALKDRLAFFGNKCVYCGTDKHLVIDHIKPISKGAPTLVCNLAPACKVCNGKKSNRWFGPYVWIKCRDQLVTNTGIIERQRPAPGNGVKI